MINYRHILIDRRKAKGISQNKLAKMTGVSQSFINLIESGKKTPSLEVFFKLCEVLEIQLFGDEYAEYRDESVRDNSSD